MPSHGTTQRRIAWLGLLAMALLVVMPVLSCVTAAPPPSMAADCMEHMAEHDSAHAAHAHHPDELLVHCGYCVLLGHTPLLGSLAIPPALLSLPGMPPHAAAHVGPAPVVPLLAAHPRGPPPPATA